MHIPGLIVHRAVSMSPTLMSLLSCDMTNEQLCKLITISFGITAYYWGLEFQV